MRTLGGATLVPVMQASHLRNGNDASQRRWLHGPRIRSVLTFATAVTDGSTVGQAPAGTRAIQLRDPDTFFSRFLELYGRSNRGAVPERNTKPNLGQALHMLAGSSFTGRLNAPDGRLAKLLGEGAADEKIFEEFYLAALDRFPDPEEMQDLKAVLAQRADRKTGLQEFVWALITSREFVENH